MITIKQIAEIAGVSPSTVSHALNGRTEKMSRETLEKVNKALEEHNYVSNMAGRLLGNGSSRIIGVLLTYARRSEMNVIQDPFFSEIIGALENEIRSNGYFMMLYTSGSIDEGLRIAASWQVEGLVVLGALEYDCARYMEGTNRPLVFIDSYFYDDGKEYVNIGLKDKQGAYLMTNYLISQGHKRIAFLADGNPPMGVAQQRREGFYEALREHGLPAFEDQYLHISHRQDERYDLLSTLLNESLREFTALFFASDFLAIDSMNFFMDHGLDVPGDISVCGFDDTILSILCRPQLTTVHQTISQKAVYAIAVLLRMLRKEVIGPRIIRLNVSLRIRDSVKQLRSAT